MNKNGKERIGNYSKRVMKKRIVGMILACLLVVGLAPGFAVQTQAAVKFKVSQKQMKKAVEGRTVKVIVNNKEQRFKVKASEITKFTVKSKLYSYNRKNVTVKAAVNIDRKVATVRATATLQYKRKGKKWKLTSVRLGKGKIVSIQLKGTWNGTYVANQGKTKARFVIDKVSDNGRFSGIFYFSAVPSNPTVPSGSYTITGRYDKAKGSVTFIGNQWLIKPYTYSIIDFHGHLNLSNKRIYSSDYSLNISKK